MGKLLMLITIGGLSLAFIPLVFAFWTRKIWLAKFVLGAVAIWLGFYTAMLFGASLISEEKTLNQNEAKVFCGFYLDCHVLTEVTNVRKAKTIGDRTAWGEFYIVKIKVSSNAKRAELELRDPQFEVVDVNDHRYKPIENTDVSDNPFERKISAGGEFESEVVFDLPTNVQNPRLDIAEGIGVNKIIESVLIGDEDSILHKRNYFGLEMNSQMANR